MNTLFVAKMPRLHTVLSRLLKRDIFVEAEAYMCVRPLFVPVLFAYKVQSGQPRIGYGAVHTSDALESVLDGRRYRAVIVCSVTIHLHINGPKKCNLYKQAETCMPIISYLDCVCVCACVCAYMHA